MKNTDQVSTELPESSLHLAIRLHQAWIDQIVNQAELRIPVTEQYQLTNTRFLLGEGEVIFSAEIQEMPGSFVELTCVPVWDATLQVLHLDDLKLVTRSKNVLLKTAAWFVKTFQQHQLDAKMEAAIAALIAQVRNKYTNTPVAIPLNGESQMVGRLRDIRIEQLAIQDGSLQAHAQIFGEIEIEFR